MLCLQRGPSLSGYTISFLPGERAPITKPRRRLPRLLVEKKSPRSFPRRRVGRYTWRVASRRHTGTCLFLDTHLDVRLQTGGLDRYGTHDSRHAPPGSKAGIRHRATLREAFGPDLQLPPSVLALGPDRSSSSPSPEETTCALIALDHRRLSQMAGGGLPLEFNVPCSSGNSGEQRASSCCFQLRRRFSSPHTTRF